MAGHAKPRFGVEPVSLRAVEFEAPFCPHGPTSVFERYYEDREPRKFFACALHRDRKGCPFFQWVDEPLSPDKRERWIKAYHETNPCLNRSALMETMESLRCLPESKRVFCYTCSELLLSTAVSPVHETHDLRYGIEDSLLVQPTKLLTPQDDRKSNASSCQLLLSELKRLQVLGVLCVGTPRLHEAVQYQLSPAVNSLLLDIDSRYAQFYAPTSYQRYNMFNGHFYEEEGEEVCREFLKSRTVAIVIDPPFGGLVEVLAKQVHQLWGMAGKEVNTVLVFPYFMEQHVSSALPSLSMCDYQVTYENHKHFSSSRKSSKPSPVRLFTNFRPPGPLLPRSEGYRLCHHCQRYTAPNNTHCTICNKCTSKDGRRYRHCTECGVCVKPARQHCSTCGTCQLPDHSCGDRVAVGCHICGSLEHKRRDCPQKAQEASDPLVVTRRESKGKKRKFSNSRTPGTKRRKKLIEV